MQTTVGSDRANTVKTPPGPWTSFWQTVTRIDTTKLEPALALRNTIGIAVPIAFGVAAGAVTTGLAVATGALNVGFTDSHAPYVKRTHRMLAASVMVGFAVFIGSSLGERHTLAIVLSVLWAFAAGMMVAVHTTAADVGTITLVTLLVYSANPLPLERAAVAGILAFCGGVLQTLLAIALWPIRRFAPERKALGDLFIELSRFAKSKPEATQSPPATAEANAAHAAIDPTSSAHTVEAERYRLLLTQAERMRLSILALTRLRIRLRREERSGRGAEVVDAYLTTASAIFGEIASLLLFPNGAPVDETRIGVLSDLTAELTRTAADSHIATATLSDAQFQMHALSGQVRAAMDLACSASAPGEVEFGQRERGRPLMLRLESTVAILRANLSLQSAALRHALRLAVCVGAGVSLGRVVGWQRVYWLPMTIAIVLKPDFSATFSRGVLRLAGTFVGLAIATVAFHFSPLGGAAGLGLVVIFTFVMRWLGAANYGIFVAAITGLVVVMLAMGGSPPNSAIAARALNTVAGGAIALIAYSIWPTWERPQIPEALARLLDSYREYFRMVREAYVAPEKDFTNELNAVRSRGRVARTNLEASVDRLSVEPRVSAGALTALNAILATSHRLVHALMALEAGLSTSERAPAREAFIPFANKLELTMYYLAAGLRHGSIRLQDLPDLREAHNALVQSPQGPAARYALVNVETDRITNALNTLAEQVAEWTGDKR